MAKQQIDVRKAAEMNGIDPTAFNNYLETHDFALGGLFSNTISVDDVPKAVERFKEYDVARQKAEAERLKAKAEKAQKEKEKQQAMAAMLVTSGFNFDGYTIKKYSGYISGDDVVSVNRDALFTENGQVLTDALVKIRIHALKELREAAYDLGCNAIIGVDFDYMTFEPETISGGVHYYQPYVVCVTANGNAVIIEKN